MRLQSIEQFIAVVDAGSIRGAARQLNMSQPALSRALQQLEEELGVQLMDRSGRGVTPTAAGSENCTLLPAYAFWKPHLAHCCRWYATR